MQNITKKLFQEPLLHFLLLGALAYFYFDYMQEKQTAAPKEPIVIENYELKNFQQKYSLQNPALALAYLKYQKILLEEAYSLELYKEDTAISKRLLEKMQYIFRSDKTFPEPSEEELKTFYSQHLDDYSRYESCDLYTITFDRNSDKKLLAKLSTLTNLLPFAQKKVSTPQSLQKEYGNYITLQLKHLPQGFWSEPLQTDKGETLFFITNKKVKKPYSFEDVEDLVYENYKKLHLLENEQKEYAKLFNKYSFEEKR